MRPSPVTRRFAALMNWLNSNAPGLRFHPKRLAGCLLRLLDAGINVYTTLNVQHLESVNDIVERITGIQSPRDAAGSRVLEEADEVEFVDISPDELGRARRLSPRKGLQAASMVEQAAGKHFFNRGLISSLFGNWPCARPLSASMRKCRRHAALSPPFRPGPPASIFSCAWAQARLPRSLCAPQNGSRPL